MKTLRYIQNFVARRLESLREGLLCGSRLLLLTSSFFLLTSCERMELYDLGRHLSLSLDLKLEIDVVIDPSKQTDEPIPTKIDPPAHHKVIFYSTEDGSQKYSTFVGTNGGEIGAPPGTYRMLTYSFGTEYIQIRGEGNINTLEAFTSDITDSKRSALRGFTRAGDPEPEEQPIIWAPDHLLVSQEKVTIPEFSEEEVVITLHAKCATIVESYTFEVPYVHGAQWIESVEAFVTNQARTSFFGRGEVSSEPATICFPVGVNRAKGYLYTEFNTFGKLPGESRSLLHILIKNTGGEEVHITTDITDQFEKEDHHIIIPEEIIIPEPEDEGAGIAPTVDPWDDEIHDVPIG